MLIELRVSDLGVVEELTLALGPGMTVLSGETGAGKTMIVTAISLLLGERADATLVRAGADEAVVDGRFVDGDREVVLSRVIPAAGRSRAYIDGRPVTLGVLADAGRSLVDLHGQHANQSLLSVRVQRAALDRFASVDLTLLEAARARRRAIDARMDELGGDERTRARELDLLEFQLAELVSAELDDPSEDELLAAEAQRLGSAEELEAAARGAAVALDADDGAGAQLAVARGLLGDTATFSSLAARLDSVVAEVGDLRQTLRDEADDIEGDPQRLAVIGERRALLAELRRKFGATLEEVIDERNALAARADDLRGAAALVAELEAQATAVDEEMAAAARVVGAARRAGAPALAHAVQAHLVGLALPDARIEVHVGPDPGDEVELALAADPGSPLLPLARAASGGELSRVMLALRLVITEAPDTLVFDEVDAGVGGSAAVSIGSALSAVADEHQVLVVTHLAQVAAAADAHVVLTKQTDGERTATTAAPVEHDERDAELARMLSGQPESDTARRHARELLDGRSASQAR